MKLQLVFQFSERLKSFNLFTERSQRFITPIVYHQVIIQGELTLGLTGTVCPYTLNSVQLFIISNSSSTKQRIVFLYSSHIQSFRKISINRHFSGVVAVFIYGKTNGSFAFCGAVSQIERDFSSPIRVIFHIRYHRLLDVFFRVVEGSPVKISGIEFYRLAKVFRSKLIGLFFTQQIVQIEFGISVYPGFPFALHTLSHIVIIRTLGESVERQCRFESLIVHLTLQMQHKRTSCFVFAVHLGLGYFDVLIAYFLNSLYCAGTRNS